MPPDGALGILAGGGTLPLRIAESCASQSRPYHVVLFQGQADPVGFAGHPHTAVRLGAGGQTIATLRANGCTSLVMAGAIRRPTLGQLRPDWWGLKFFLRSGAANKGDDGLLKALIAALEREGFAVFGADQLLPDLLAPRGVLGRIAPPADRAPDIAAAIAAARALGERDVGQAAVVVDCTAIAEEDRRGTDAMLRDLAARGNAGGVLAKTLKPGQERRVDLPTIGPETIRNAHAAGLMGIVVEAGNAFVMDRPATVATADEMGLFLVGVDAEGRW